jgi:integrase/recombinase XerD
MTKDFKKYLIRNEKLSFNTVNLYCFYVRDLEVFNFDISHLLGEKNYSISQIKILKYSIVKFNKYLNLINKNEIDISNIPNIKIENKIPKYLTINECKKILKINSRPSAFYNERNKLIIKTFLETGIRVSELIKITKKDLFENKILIRGKGNKERFVIVSDSYINQLNQFKILVDDYIFINFNKKPLTRKGVYNIIRSIGIKASLNKEISPHILRHTFATQMLQIGVDIYSVSKLLGHSSISVTQTYLHFDSNTIKLHKKLNKNYY